MVNFRWNFTLIFHSFLLVLPVQLRSISVFEGRSLAKWWNSMLTLNMSFFFCYSCRFRSWITFCTLLISLKSSMVFSLNCLLRLYVEPCNYPWQVSVIFSTFVAESGRQFLVFESLGGRVMYSLSALVSRLALRSNIEANGACCHYLHSCFYRFSILLCRFCSLFFMSCIFRR